MKIMKKELLIGAAALTLAGIAGTTASAATLGTAPGTGTVNFLQGSIPVPTDPTMPGINPIDPQIPGITVPPGSIDPGNGLAMTYAPNLNFGSHPIDFSNNNSYYAYAMNYSNSANGDDTTASTARKTGPLFIQVSDMRGLDNGAWSVGVTASEFVSDGQNPSPSANEVSQNTGAVLKGATISFNADSNSTVVPHDNAIMPNATDGTVNGTTGQGAAGPLVLQPGVMSNIFSSGSADASGAHGQGTLQLSFGDPATRSNLYNDVTTRLAKTDKPVLNTPENTLDLNVDNNYDSVTGSGALDANGQLTSGVQLNVLAGSAKATRYNSTLTWTLFDTPNAQ
ncbi:MAG: WxL domain-containing protein [Streptococcaceae bacterium]|nr:WxL domain-containing protein [Streptococcaceae bacterium]